jgi:hypothetical protein
MTKPSIPSDLRAILASIFIVGMLVPHLVLLIHPIEDFPLTSMPMFSAYAGPDRHRYRYHFIADLDTNTPVQREVTARDIDQDESRFMRYFLYDVYRSIDPDNPVTRYEHDDRAQFEERLARFFRSYVHHFHQQHPDQPRIKGIRLLIERTHPSPATHEVGRYDTASSRFTHTWRPQP